MNQIPSGTWVEIEQVILTPEQRSPNLPEDTKHVPYVMRVSGFLIEPAELEGPSAHPHPDWPRAERSAQAG